MQEGCFCVNRPHPAVTIQSLSVSSIRVIPVLLWKCVRMRLNIFKCAAVMFLSCVPSIAAWLIETALSFQVASVTVEYMSWSASEKVGQIRALEGWPLTHALHLPLHLSDHLSPLKTSVCLFLAVSSRVYCWSAVLFRSVCSLLVFMVFVKLVKGDQLELSDVASVMYKRLWHKKSPFYFYKRILFLTGMFVFVIVSVSFMYDQVSKMLQCHELWFLYIFLNRRVTVC